MNKLTLKHYPANMVSIFICLIAAINFLFTALWSEYVNHKPLTFWQQLVCIVTAYGLALTALTLLNRFGMWKWYLALIGVCDMRGEYEGELVSSFREFDNDHMPNVHLFMQATIVQNLNGFQIKCRFYTDAAYTQLLSESVSYDENLTKEPDGTFKITYFYHNKGVPFQPASQTAGPHNYEGVCVLTFSAPGRVFKGYYYTHIRASYGQLVLRPLG
jgi:hypothetical protein